VEGDHPPPAAKAERLVTLRRASEGARRVAGKPLAAYQVGRLANAGVTRVIFACAAGQASLFESELADIGPELVCAEEPERLGRGGGIKSPARLRQENGRRARAQRRRARRRRLRRPARAPAQGGALGRSPPQPTVRSSDSSTSTTTYVVHGFREAARSRSG